MKTASNGRAVALKSETAAAPGEKPRKVADSALYRHRAVTAPGADSDATTVLTDVPAGHVSATFVQPADSEIACVAAVAAPGVAPGVGDGAAPWVVPVAVVWLVAITVVACPGLTGIVPDAAPATENERIDVPACCWALMV